MSIISPARIAGTFDSHNNLLPHEVDELARQGVPTVALLGPDPVRVGYVVFDESGFEFEQHHRHGTEGVRALLFAITDCQGIYRDIVAWSSRLNQTAAWLNRAWAFGEGRVYAPRLSPQGGLPVWRTPIGWLRANRRGICLIRPEAAAYHLDCSAPLIAEDAAHGAELKRLLTIPAPRILVPALSMKAA